MFDFFSDTTTDSNDAIDLLKRDHNTVKELFDQFEKAEGRAARRKIVTQAVQELKLHAAIEEDIFYPTVRKQVGGEIMNEADEEHHVAKVLIAELDEMDGKEDHYDAKFMVLAESVRHHIKEEEGEMLPKARDLKIDFEKLGEQMMRRKQQLMTKGVPPAAEAKMVAASRRSGDSPAKAAHKKKPSATRKRKAA